MIEHAEKLKILEKKTQESGEAKDEAETALKAHYEAFFIFAGLWAIGGMVGG